MTEADHGSMRHHLAPDSYSATVEWHPTARLWVAYRCGCAECPKGFGKTKEEAIADLMKIGAGSSLKNGRLKYAAGAGVSTPDDVTGIASASFATLPKEGSER